MLSHPGLTDLHFPVCCSICHITCLESVVYCLSAVHLSVLPHQLLYAHGACNGFDTDLRTWFFTNAVLCCLVYHETFFTIQVVMLDQHTMLLLLLLLSAVIMLLLWSSMLHPFMAQHVMS